MERVAVVGPVGAGKTTFGRQLAARTGLPWVPLDDVYWQDAAVPSEVAWRSIHRDLIVSKRWIIDGDYRATADERFARADTIIWLDMPRWRCVSQILLRAVRGYPAPLRDCLRWTWRYPSHGRRETVVSVARSGTVVYRARRGRDRDHLLTMLAPSHAG